MQISLFEVLIIIAFVIAIFIVLSIVKGLFKNNKQFSAFHSQKEVSKMDVISSLLLPYREYSKLITVSNYVIFITEYGFTEALFIDYDGSLSGKQEDERWTLTNAVQTTLVNNPLLEFERFCQAVDNIVGDFPTKKCILVDSRCFFMVSQSNYQLLKLNDVYYTLTKREAGKKYTPAQIDEMYNKIKSAINV